MGTNTVIIVKWSTKKIIPAFIKIEQKARSGQKAFYPVTTEKKDDHNHTIRLRKNCENIKNSTFPCFVCVKWHQKSDTSISVEELIIGQVSSFSDGEHGAVIINLEKLKIIESELIIDNFMKFTTLDLKAGSKDFADNSYVKIEYSLPLTTQLRFAYLPAYTEPKHANYNHVASKSKSEYQLPVYAQKEEDAYRLIGFLEKDPNREEFQRDYERIVHSKAFRRMVDKAQIFTATKGAHYRTRMTHTLAVSQIARGISHPLKLNTFLTEAIALGHDIGHTPFGHQGERTLEDILSEYEKEFGKEKSISLGGFKHNYQSMRVACVLEEEYFEYRGLDLTIQTLEGIWKHSSIQKDGKPSCILEQFLPYGTPQEIVCKFFPDQEFASTLEGQVVAVADEIAQRSHDLEDALMANILSLEELFEYLSFSAAIDAKTKIEELVKVRNELLEKNRIYANKDEILYRRIASSIIGLFTQECIQQSCKNIKNSSPDKNLTFREKLIQLPPRSQALNDYIESIVKSRVISSVEVAVFDDRANRVVRGLFEAYYKNPNLLHPGTQNRILSDFLSITTDTISFIDGDKKLIKDEWGKIKRSRPSDSNDIYWKKHVVLLRAITDFIAGMTDEYALEEYGRIVK